MASGTHREAVDGPENAPAGLLGLLHSAIVEETIPTWSFIDHGGTAYPETRTACLRHVTYDWQGCTGGHHSTPH